MGIVTVLWDTISDTRKGPVLAVYTGVFLSLVHSKLYFTFVDATPVPTAVVEFAALRVAITATAPVAPRLGTGGGARLDVVLEAFPAAIPVGRYFMCPGALGWLRGVKVDTFGGRIPPAVLECVSTNSDGTKTVLAVLDVPPRGMTEAASVAVPVGTLGVDPDYLT